LATIKNSKTSTLDMFIEANKNPKKDELGSKSINSLFL
jgi:hypothetical protein